MSYAKIDPALEAWIAERGLFLFTEFAGKPARFFYFSNQIGECCQVFIKDLQDGNFMIGAWIVDSPTDRDLSVEREFLEAEIVQGLTNVFHEAMSWLNLP
jgi:hypothetical protein